MSSPSKHIFADRKTLILTMAEIKTLLPMDECIEIQKTVFSAHAKGEALNAPNTWLRLPDGRRWMKLLAGYVGPADTMGLKVLARFPDNPPGMNVGGLVGLFDTSDGFPLAIMDAIYFTAIRTAAGGGLSAQYCARKDSKGIGIVGSGVQARFNLVAIKQLLPQIEWQVFSRSQERRETFATRMRQETGLQIETVDTVEAAVAGTDIVITATNSPQPVFTPKHLEPGMHVVMVGISSEVDPAIFKGMRVIADGKEIAMEDGKFSLAIKAGVVTREDMGGNMGDVINGTFPGRANDQEITGFDSSGLAVQDMICAHHCYQKAKQKGQGTWIDLGLGDAP